MALSDPGARRELHHRFIDMRAYAREDGRYDVESHLVDRKPFEFRRFSATESTPAGQALHDFWLRVTIDGDLMVREIQAASHVTPFGICKEAEGTLSGLVGERIGRGWSAIVKERLRGAAGCTHLMEMLIPLATTALQGIRALNSERNAAAVNAKGEPVRIDSCYAYGRERAIVQRLWPAHYRPPGGQPLSE
ncbi:DUF2889 domain-containing protein [Comamonadaceae bacterium G21597-S1]|nr:DUF2889 domain-containing protein [Comamonadaceae bacterium G21597-S1]